MRCTPQRLAVYDHLSQSTAASHGGRCLSGGSFAHSQDQSRHRIQSARSLGRRRSGDQANRGNRRKLCKVRCTPRPALPFSLPAIRNRSRLADPIRPRSDRQARPALAGRPQSPGFSGDRISPGTGRLPDKRQGRCHRLTSRRSGSAAPDLAGASSAPLGAAKP